jgi:DNA-binding transcriptional regulator LsrR (DeoR family)
MPADGPSTRPPRESDPARTLARIADIAADVLQPLPREGALAGQEGVARRYGVHRTFVSAAVRRAVRENLLSIRIQRLPILKRDAHLEDELLRRFPRLALTRVVEEGPAPEAGQDPQQDEHDLHSRVGTAMSSAIAEENLIHTGAVCLVGSGRAVAHTALALGQRSEPLKSRRVKLLSTSGGYPLMTVRSSGAIGIDADTCTRALAQAFAENVEVHTMAFPIMAPTASAMKLFREMSWTGVASRGGKGGRQPAPEIALVGVGGLNPHNDARFGFVEKHHWEGSSAFKSLKSLIELQAKIRDKDCLLVADIANHFVAVREDERFLPNKDKAAFADALRRLNRGLLSLPVGELESLDEILLVAADRSGLKGKAIYQFLDDARPAGPDRGEVKGSRRARREHPPRLPIKVLCVNRAIAQRIVDLDRARASRAEATR